MVTYGYVYKAFVQQPEAGLNSRPVVESAYSLGHFIEVI